MKVDVLLGLQWGDEGKGKIVDYLAPKYDVVARFQGGPNAGHTLEFEGIKQVLHQIPSGIFRKSTRNVIGNGVVLDPIVFRKEVHSLAKHNVDPSDNLYISNKAQLIIPTHRLLDQAYEAAKGEQKIGSTLKGIGPAYSDKIGRQGLRMGDILTADFKTKFNKLISIHFNILERFDITYNWAELEAEFFDAVGFIKNFKFIDSEYFLNAEIKSGSKILAEGAQGSLLDVDFGSYPFVTSSNTISAGACTGLGISPSSIGEVYGIFKAYSTRVGGGPFPTELLNEEGELMRKCGNEFGSTTGRPRRCGWIDLPSLKYAIMINGITQLFMMKSDVLSVFPEIKICTHYKYPDGNTSSQLPYNLNEVKVEPVYHTMKGWNTNIEQLTENRMPPVLDDYINYLEHHLGVPISLISFGPNRDQTLLRKTV